MTIGTIPTLLTDIAAIVGAFTVIVGGFVMMIKLPPAKFVMKRLVSDPVDEWVRDQVMEATKCIRRSTDESAHLISYHLGSNDTTMPVHERLSRMEKFHGLEPVKQIPNEPTE